MADVPEVYDPALLLRTWGGDPLVAWGLPVLAALYAWGSRRLRWTRRAAFFGGLGVIAVATLSPVEAVAGALFTGHMVQHLLLVLVAPPLLLAGAPWASLLRAAGPVRGSLVRLLGPVRRVLLLPLVAGGAHAVAIWIWHAPALYEAALWNRWMHLLEHACFLGTALAFWAVVLRAGRGGVGAGAAALLVFATAVQSSILGALLGFAPRPLYPTHVPGAVAFGMHPLEDQQLAGLLMWVPGGFVYAGTALWLVARWMARAGGSTAWLQEGAER